jgi:hypothetical protein
MSLNSYLENLANNLILSSSEKISIETSISTLKSRLESYFGNELEEHFTFGSYTRVTMLPRKVDENTDVDYMVVFDNTNNYKPQTFLDRLKRFGETKYSTSEIYQSSPTMILELNHIKFELVPAYKSYYGTYYISDGNGGWMTTYPNDFNSQLTKANNNNSYKIKPLVRLIKEWNVSINYHDLTSYKIEERIANNMTYSYYSCTSYTDYAKEAFNQLKNITYDSSIRNRIDTALSRINKAMDYENDNMPYSALGEIKKVFPEV